MAASRHCRPAACFRAQLDRAPHPPARHVGVGHTQPGLWLLRYIRRSCRCAAAVPVVTRFRACACLHRGRILSRYSDARPDIRPAARPSPLLKHVENALASAVRAAAAAVRRSGIDPLPQELPRHERIHFIAHRGRRGARQFVRLRAGVAPRGDRRHVDGATREPTRNRPADHRRCRRRPAAGRSRPASGRRCPTSWA